MRCYSQTKALVSKYLITFSEVQSWVLQLAFKAKAYPTSVHSLLSFTAVVPAFLDQELFQTADTGS